MQQQGPRTEVLQTSYKLDAFRGRAFEEVLWNVRLQFHHDL